jgi:hypothetical protein
MQQADAVAESDSQTHQIHPAAAAAAVRSGCHTGQRLHLIGELNVAVDIQAKRNVDKPAVDYR